MSEKDTSLTPLSLIEKLGVFDLDPCAVEGHNTAKNLIVLPRNGLEEKWEGRVWCNPPYSSPGPWLEKLSLHKDGIALVLASVETKWFQNEIFDKSDGILFLRGRPKFMRRDRSFFQIMRPVVLVAYGEKNYQILYNADLEGKRVRLL